MIKQLCPATPGRYATFTRGGDVAPKMQILPIQCWGVDEKGRVFGLVMLDAVRDGVEPELVKVTSMAGWRFAGYCGQSDRPLYENASIAIGADGTIEITRTGASEGEALEIAKHLGLTSR